MIIMNNKFYVIIFISLAFCVTGIDFSDRIIIDGLSDEYTLDEFVLSDSVGNLLESPADSYWGEYNDIKQIKVTWDLNSLYIALDACSWDNNVLFYLDIFNDYGIEDMSQMNAWQRSFKFHNLNPDFFIGTWDTNDSPQFWRVQNGGTMQADLLTSVETVSTYDTGNLLGSMEMRIPWDVLYFDDLHSIQEYPRIKMVAVITSGDDQSSGPDCAPDNLGGMANSSGQMVILDNYVEILIDANNDGLPDANIEPQKNSYFYKKPPFNTVPLKVENIMFQSGKVFSPLIDQYIFFSLQTNRVSEFNVEIYNLEGRYINNAELDNTELSWKWNGRDLSGSLVDFGVYILRFISASGEVSHKETVVVIK